MIKPNFYIIGAAKSATTSLATLLGKHPEATIAKEKEPHFFSIGSNTESALQTYLLNYAHCTNEIAVGDASTSYSRIRYNPNTIQRIYDFTPDAKIIYLIRHPLERIESAYASRTMRSDIEHRESLSKAVRQIPMMVDSSRYWEVFDAYRQVFPEKNIKVIWFEEFIQNQPDVFASICHFLGIDALKEIASNPVHSNSRGLNEKLSANLGRTMSHFDTHWEEETRNYVINQLREDNLQILRYFDKGDDYWGNIFA